MSPQYRVPTGSWFPFLLDELIVYFLAEQTAVELYYFGILDDSKQIFSRHITFQKLYLWDIFWWVIQHVFTYLRTLIGFINIFRNTIEKSSLEFNSYFFPWNRDIFMLMSSNFYSAHVVSRSFSFPHENCWSGNRPLLFVNTYSKENKQ